MQFSNTTDKEHGIIQGIEMLCYGKYAAITGDTTTRLRFFTQQVNIWLNLVGQWIHEVSDEWPFDDRNNTNFPIESYSFTDDQQNYGLDSDIKAIYKVEIHDVTKTEPEGWSEIEFQLKTDRVEDPYAQDSGTPTSYFFDPGHSITFDVPVDTAVIDKYRLTYTRDMHLFEDGDTTAEPGFNVTIHPLLVYGPSMSWAMLNNTDGSKNGLIGLCKQMIGHCPLDPGFNPAAASGLYLALVNIHAKANKGFLPAVTRKYSTYE